jgi:hypothetical protein
LLLQSEASALAHLYSGEEVVVVVVTDEAVVEVVADPN